MLKNVVIILVIVLAIPIHDASASSAVVRHSAAVEAAIFSAPLYFNYGEILVYKIKLTNRTEQQQIFELFFLVGGEIAPQKGPPYRRLVALRPYRSSVITFRVMVKGPPPIPSTGAFCLTVWLPAANVFDSGAFTCAYAK